MFSEDFEKTLIEAIKEAVDDCSIDLLSDMVKDNPDWWAGEIKEVFTDTIKKALKDAELIKAVVSEMLAEYLSEIDLQIMASEIIEEKIKDSILDKISVEVKK